MGSLLPPLRYAWGPLRLWDRYVFGTVTTWNRHALKMAKVAP